MGGAAWDSWGRCLQQRGLSHCYLPFPRCLATCCLPCVVCTTSRCLRRIAGSWRHFADHTAALGSSLLECPCRRPLHGMAAELWVQAAKAYERAAQAAEASAGPAAGDDAVQVIAWRSEGGAPAPGSIAWGRVVAKTGPPTAMGEPGVAVPAPVLGPVRAALPAEPAPVGADRSPTPSHSNAADRRRCKAGSANTVASNPARNTVSPLSRVAERRRGSTSAARTVASSPGKTAPGTGHRGRTRRRSSEPSRAPSREPARSSGRRGEAPKAEPPTDEDQDEAWGDWKPCKSTPPNPRAKRRSPTREQRCSRAMSAVLRHNSRGDLVLADDMDASGFVRLDRLAEVLPAYTKNEILDVAYDSQKGGSQRFEVIEDTKGLYVRSCWGHSLEVVNEHDDDGERGRRAHKRKQGHEDGPPPQTAWGCGSKRTHRRNHQRRRHR